MSVTAELKFEVAWGDCDPANIVFYPNYFRWFDAGAHNLLRMICGGLAELSTRYGVVGLPLVEVHSHFKAPTRFGDRLVLTSRIESWERKVLRIQHTLLNNAEVSMEGVETRAWCVSDKKDASVLRAAAIPAEVIALFQS